MKTTPLPGIILLTAATCMANPAVSGFNGKFGALHGSMDSEDITSLEGSITWPVMDCFGMQLDGLYSNTRQKAFGFARTSDVDTGGVGAHFFWRDSETAMVGLGTGYVFSDPVDSWELGIEAEKYFDWLTLGGKMGVASISFDSTAAPAGSDEDSFFCQLYVGAYPVNDLWVSLLVENRFENTSYGVEVEYELPVNGLSFFANAMHGDHDYDHAYVGMRYYFGGEKPLRNRHRASDPKNLLHGIQHGIGTYRAEIHEQITKSAARPNGGTGNTGGAIGGSGTIGGSLTVGGSGPIGPGSSPGTGPLTVGGVGSLVLNPLPNPESGTLIIDPQHAPLVIGPWTYPGSGFNLSVP